MLFFAKLVTSLPVIAGVCSTASAAVMRRAMDSDTMVMNINKLTQQSKQVTTVVQNFNSNDGLGITPNYQAVVDGFRGIIETARQDISAMSGTAPYTDEAAEQQVCDAFRDFVVVHQNLLSVLIGKSGLLQSVFLGPIASVLRSLEGVVDTLAFGIIDSVPSCADDATNNKNQLDDTVGKAICAYTPGGSLGVDLLC